ncbi:uncharacterized protein LOC126974330 [Leptidea sinapis]|uniref:uncharacterized protein LOC126974330 n=1 Tax=Leptidea sinapis TaxID=189913 RepID=UPI0021C32FBB|nr:uncharacterized protein LOC126974330 [Leptidea sinapis]
MAGFGVNMLKFLAPKNFLCKFPLSVGAISASGLALFIQIMLIRECDQCSRSIWRNAYGFSVVGIIYSVIMLFVHIGFLWGVKKEKSSIVFGWVVVTSMWVAQTFCLLIVFICLYNTQVRFISWILSLIFGLLAICILIYIVLIGFGFWLELKEKKKNANVNIAG